MAGPISRNSLSLLQSLGIAAGPDQFIRDMAQTVLPVIDIERYITEYAVEPQAFQLLAADSGTIKFSGWTNVASNPVVVVGLYVQATQALPVGDILWARPALARNYGSALLPQPISNDETRITGTGDTWFTCAWFGPTNPLVLQPNDQIGLLFHRIALALGPQFYSTYVLVRT